MAQRKGVEGRARRPAAAAAAGECAAAAAAPHAPLRRQNVLTRVCGFTRNTT